tara:strand:- start:1308 stop:1883 length:576 start_codon:yes stop_codon:yes gene_type:complete
MKTYEDFQYNAFQSELRSWDTTLIEKANEWNNLSEESQKEILDGFCNGDEKIIEEWGPLEEGLGTALKRTASVVTKIPGIRTGYELGRAGYRAAKGDYTGAALSLGSAIPGPVGWGFVAADVGRDIHQANKANQKQVPTNTQKSKINQNPKNKTTNNKTTTQTQVKPVKKIKFGVGGRIASSGSTTSSGRL